MIEKVEFAVVVVAQAGQPGSAGSKHLIASINSGAAGKKESSNKPESRIKFSIPMVYPGVDNAC